MHTIIIQVEGASGDYEIAITDKKAEYTRTFDAKPHEVIRAQMFTGEKIQLARAADAVD